MKEIYELNIGDKVKCTIQMEDWSKYDELLTYKWMDGMYWKLVDKEWRIFNAFWKLYPVEDHYVWLQSDSDGNATI